MTLWNDNLLIGVPHIDAQHKKLVAAIDDLMDASLNQRGKDAVEKTLSFVESYTKTHFADEERLHAQNAFPQASAHKRAHASFISTLDGLHKEFTTQGATSSLSMKLNKTLVDWLVTHIKTDDKRYADFINKSN